MQYCISGAGMSINRKTITLALQKKLHTTHEIAQGLLTAILSSIEESIISKETIIIPNFGSFSIKERQPSICAINNKPVKTLTNMRFHAASNLTSKLNHSDTDDFFM